MSLTRFAYLFVPLAALSTARGQSSPNPLDNGLRPASSAASAGNPLAALTGYTDRNTWAAAAGGTPTLVDFDSLPDGTLVTGTGALLPWGIADTSGTSIHGPGAVSQFVYCSCTLPFPMFIAGTLPSEPNFFANNINPGNFACGDLTFVFAADTNACGAFVADQSGLGSFTIEVFDGGGVSMGSITVPPRILPDSFVGVVSTIPFASAEFRSTNQDDSWGLDNVEHVSGSTGSPVCFGDGTGAGCPCNNTGGPGAGCANGTGGGGILSASGVASVTADTMSLTADGVINNNGLFFQGNNTIGGGAGTAFGDGIRCCGGSVIRIQIVNPPGSSSPATAQMTETATTNGPSSTISAGTKKCYQYWYRDPATSPCGSQFNLTNAVTITWQP